MNLTFFYPLLRFDTLSISSALACIFFTLLIGIYSFKFLKGKVSLIAFYAYFFLTAIVSCVVLLSNNLILLLIAWGFLGLTLYLLINLSTSSNATSTAKKTLIIIGASDSIMILGVGIIFYLARDFQMDRIQIPLGGLNWSGPVLAYLCLAIAAFAKAGVMPFHTWIPDCAADASIPVTAYLPASLDKLLGIYLLARISLDLFVMNQLMNIFLMLIGALTIILAVMMALVQHDMKRLFGYHAVSQVGYMVLGIGTGNPIGIAGAIFHMFNHALYKSCLFLTAGNIEQRTQTTELDKLGGLSKTMPVTYISALIASLAISGVPPLNGFFSKWLIYQGLVKDFADYKYIALFCLTLAMFGSALTLASFIKVIHAVFLGIPSQKILQEKPREVSWMMFCPVLILSLICVIFGVFAYQLPLKYIIYPIVGITPVLGGNIANISTILIIVGIFLGLVVYLARIKKISRSDNCFVGGETISAENKVSGTEFYNTIKEFGLFNNIYKKAQSGTFDIYEQAKILVLGAGKFLQYLHNGILPTYLVWTLLGMIILFWNLFR